MLMTTVDDNDNDNDKVIKMFQCNHTYTYIL